MSRLKHEIDWQEKPLDVFIANSLVDPDSKLYKDALVELSALRSLIGLRGYSQLGEKRMSKLERELERGGLVFWLVVILTALGLYSFIFLAMALGGLLA